ncbi:hypothetical protein OROMI_006030 [Orobanche minor]
MLSTKTSPTETVQEMLSTKTVPPTRGAARKTPNHVQYNNCRSDKRRMIVGQRRQDGGWSKWVLISQSLQSPISPGPLVSNGPISSGPPVANGPFPPGHPVPNEALPPLLGRADIAFKYGEMYTEYVRKMAEFREHILSLLEEAFHDELSDDEEEVSDYDVYA